MKWKKLIRAALRSILRNRMRSFLTMLGMIIGVGSVIALVSLGNGTQAAVEAEINALGTNMLMVRSGSSQMGGVSRGASSLNTITMDDVDRLESDATLLSHVSPVIAVQRQIIAGNNNWATSVTGVSPTYTNIKDWKVESGTFFTDRDEKTKAKVAVLGKTVADELFPDEDPVGERLRIGNVPFKVIGVMSEKGESGMGMDQDDVVLAPATTVLYRLSDGETVGMIMASAVSADQVEAAKEEMESLLRAEHKLRDGENDDFNVRTQSEIVERATSITGTLTLMLGAVAGVSLVVGGIGIMNIMLVSVTERTREIGIRLAIGARDSDVLVQFLIEAVTISSIGGMFGIAFGVGAGYLIGEALGIGVVVNPAIIGVAFFVSAAVGIFFGFYPARKAAALDPIAALHYE
jgi:putative ABC transport system permease protein